MKTKYFIFGSKACFLFSVSTEELLNDIKGGYSLLGDSFKLFEWTPDKKLPEALEAFSGYYSYLEIKESDYNKIKETADEFKN